MPFYAGVIVPFSLSVVAVSVILVITLIVVGKKGLVHLSKSWAVTRWVTTAVFAFAWMFYFIEVRQVEDPSTNTVQLALDGVFLFLLAMQGLVTVTLSLWAKKNLVASRTLKLAQSTRQQKGAMQIVSIKIKEVTPRGADSLELKSILREPEPVSDIHRVTSESALVNSGHKGDGNEDVLSARSTDDSRALSPPASTSAVPGIGSCDTSSDSIALTK